MIAQMTARDILNENLLEFGFSPDCRAFLLGLWDATQFFDDVKDGDPPELTDDVLWFCLVGMPSNPFFARNSGALVPGMATAICKWNAANDLESAGLYDARAYAWRACFYDVVMLAAILDLGRDHANAIAVSICNMIGETLGQFIAEGKNG